MTQIERIEERIASIDKEMAERRWSSSAYLQFQAIAAQLETALALAVIAKLKDIEGTKL